MSNNWRGSYKPISEERLDRLVRGIEKMREQDKDIKLEYLNTRIRRDPKNFVLAMIGHLDGDLILNNYPASTWTDAVNKLWKVYDKF